VCNANFCFMNKFLNLVIKVCFAFIMVVICLYLVFIVFIYLFGCSSADIVTVS